MHDDDENGALMLASKMIQAQADLAERFDSNSFFKMTAALFVKDHLRPHVFGNDLAENTVRALEMSRVAIRHASVYRVTAEMTQVIQHAAASLSEEDEHDASIAPTRAGLVHFEGGLPITEARGDTMLLDWIFWLPATYQETPTVGRRAGYFAWEFNDVFDNPDGHAAQMLRDPESRDAMRIGLGRWGMMGINMARDGMSLGPAVVEPVGLQAARILADGDIPSPATNTRRILHALWLMMSQTITETSKPTIPPKVKQAAKGKRIKSPDVTVIELRRRTREAVTAGAEDTVQSRRQYTHRWVVRGFWRWQRYGPGRTEKKRIWIDPYVKGPDDAPLLTTKHVYELKR